MKCRKHGFTIVELLTAVAIIAMLVALLIPALSMVRKIAKETAQKAQFTTIDLALTAFKNDDGDYPPSDNPGDYCGAQKLAEALLGWDLMGFHPDTDWDAAGTAYEPPTPSVANLKERRGPYIELATTNAFKLDDLFDDTTPLEKDTFVICDVFGVKKITINEKTFKAGSPILYYKANTSSKKMTGLQPNRIYSSFNNLALLKLNRMTDNKPHPLGDGIGDYFYDEDYKIIDPKILDATEKKWPYRPDSYILISAGADGLYGTSDDICNFED